jgi:2-methylcitrate dehydratase PrpD
MSHADAVHALQPAAGATAALVEFVSGLRYGALDAEVRHYARRHLLDTVGVMICGAEGDVANRAEAALCAVRGGGHIPVPGRMRRADLLDAAFLGATAAHGIELDDGYRQGSGASGLRRRPGGAGRRLRDRSERRGRDRGDGRRI